MLNSRVLSIFGDIQLDNQNLYHPYLPITFAELFGS